MSSGAALRIWLVVLLIVSVFAVLQRPFDQLGYDLAVAVAVAAALIIPHVAALRASELRRSGEARRAGPLAFVLGYMTQMVMAGVAVLLVPFAVILVRGLFGGHCDFGTGLLWYALIPGISVAYAAAVGVFFGLLFRSRVLAVVGSYLFLLVGTALAVRHAVVDPPIFLFDNVLGYIAGPIYDERVAFTPALLWARFGTVVWTVLLVGASAAVVNPRRAQLEPVQFLALDGSLGNLLPRATVILGVITLIGLHVSRQETGVAPTAASIQATLGGRAESDNFVIYYSDDITDSTDVALLVQDHEFRLAQILDTFGLDRRPFDEKIESYVYPDPETKKRLMGARGTSFADPFDRAMHLNAAGYPHPVLKHELVHVVSSAFSGWPGFNPRIGIHEGLAVAVDWEQNELVPDEWAAIMRNENLLPPLSELTSMSGFWRSPPARAYLATGSFIRYLLDTQGADHVREFFGDSDYTKHFGQPLDELEAGWHRMLDTVPITPEARAFALSSLKRGAIFDRSCPRRVAELADEARTAYARGRYQRALEGYDRMLALSPDDNTARVGKLRALVALSLTTDAEVFGRTILSSDGGGPTSALVHDLLGNAAWIAGDRDRAREHYLAVAGSGAPDYLLRAADAKLSVLDEDAYRRVLAEPGGEAADVATLTSLTLWGPERTLARYLLGRRLYNEQAWRDAEEQLRDATTGMLPSDDLKAEALRLLGIVRHRLGEDAGAEAAFTELADMHRTRAEVIRARAWVDRTRWRRGLPFAEWPDPAQDVVPPEDGAVADDDAAVVPTEKASTVEAPGDAPAVAEADASTP